MDARIVRIAEVELPFSADAGPPFTAATVTYQWRRTMRLTRMFFSYVNWHSANWSNAGASKVTMRVQDQNGWYLTTDGRDSIYVASYGLMGDGRRWFPVNKVVLASDVWTIDLSIESSGTFTPLLYFEVEDMAGQRVA